MPEHVLTSDIEIITDGGRRPLNCRDGGRKGKNDFIQRNTTIMTWNLLHMTRMLKQAGGTASHGNDHSG